MITNSIRCSLHLAVLLILMIIPTFFLKGQELISDNPLQSTVDTIIHQSVQKYFSNAGRRKLSLAIYYNNEEHFYNYVRHEGKMKNIPDEKSKYEIGSISKTFAAHLLAQAVHENRVSLSDDIRLYLDDQYPNLQYGKAYIKLEQLLNHSSGLPFDFIDRTEFKNTQDRIILNKLADIENNYKTEQLLSDLHEVKLDTVPGIKLSYSNVAVQLLGIIIEKVYGSSYPDLIKRYITDPLSMNNTAFGVLDWQQGFTKGTPVPHIASGLAGGLFSSTEDMIKYGQYHLNEKNPIVALTHSPTWGDARYYAMGLNWQMQPDENGNRRIWQSGSTMGSTSLVSIYPELSTTISILTNTHDENSEGDLSNIDKKIILAML